MTCQIHDAFNQTSRQYVFTDCHPYHGQFEGIRPHQNRRIGRRQNKSFHINDRRSATACVLVFEKLPFAVSIRRILRRHKLQQHGYAPIGRVSVKSALNQPGYTRNIAVFSGNQRLQVQIITAQGIRRISFHHGAFPLREQHFAFLFPGRRNHEMCLVEGKDAVFPIKRAHAFRDISRFLQPTSGGNLAHPKRDVHLHEFKRQSLFLKTNLKTVSRNRHGYVKGNPDCLVRAVKTDGAKIVARMQLGGIYAVSDPAGISDKVHFADGRLKRRQIGTVRHDVQMCVTPPVARKRNRFFHHGFGCVCLNLRYGRQIRTGLLFVDSL